MRLAIKKKADKRSFISLLSYLVLPKGFEPLSMVPETIILSIELREQLVRIWECKYTSLSGKTQVVCQN